MEQLHGDLIPTHTVPNKQTTPYSYVRLSPQTPPEGEDSGTLITYLQIVRRHKGWLLLAAALGIIAGLLYAFPQAPIYQATLSLEIQGLNEDFLNLRSVNPMMGGSYDASYEIQTQIRILQSRELMERVIQKMQSKAPANAAPPTDRWTAWRKALRLGSPKDDPASDSILMAAGTVKVRSTLNTRIVEISCDSVSPAIAAEFANTLAEEFIATSMETRWKSTQRTGEWLTRQIEDLKITLEKSENALQDYTHKVGLVFTGEKDKENVADERLRQLQGELLKAQSERISKQSRYELAKQSPPDTLPEIVDDPQLTENQSKLSELHRQAAELGTTLTPEHYKIKRIEAQIAALEKAVDKSRSNILQRISNDYKASLNREQMLAADYQQQSQLVTDQAANMTHYSILKREVDTNRQLYEAMLQRVKEAGIAAAMKASGIRVIDRALPPSGPYKPNLSRTAVLGGLMGLLTGLGLVFLRERADRTLQQPGDVALYLNIPELGAIPSSSLDRARGLRAIQQYASGSGNGTTVLGNGNSAQHERVELVTAAGKTSLVAEAFRATLTSLLLSSRIGSLMRVVVTTSASPSEGKTTVALNLALALAEIKRRVVLVDGDMRKPRVHEILGLDRSPGLSDLLQQAEPLTRKAIQDVIQTTPGGVHTICSGRISVSASNLLYSPRFPELLDHLRSEFDLVLIDSPPALHLSDARIIAQLADAVVLIVRARQTTRDEALVVKQRLVEDGAHILGSVLNDWNPRLDSVGYGYRGYEKHRAYSDKNREHQRAATHAD